MPPEHIRDLAHSLEYQDRRGLPEIKEVARYLRQLAKEQPVAIYVYKPESILYGVKWLINEPLPDGTPLYIEPRLCSAGDSDG